MAIPAMAPDERPEWPCELVAPAEVAAEELAPAGDVAEDVAAAEVLVVVNGSVSSSGQGSPGRSMKLDCDARSF